MAHILLLVQQTIKTIKESKEMKQKYIEKLTETERSQPTFRPANSAKEAITSQSLDFVV